jgi:diguanylate cyclase (GGDEF)-like protein
VSITARDERSRFIRQIADLQVLPTLESAIKTLIVQASEFFSVTVSVWQVTAKSLIETLQPGETGLLTVSRNSSASLPNRRDASERELIARVIVEERQRHFGWVLDMRGRWLWLRIDLPESRELFLCMDSGVAKLENEFLEMVSAQASSVLSSVRHAELSERRARLLELVNTATRVALESDELSDVLHQIVSFLRDQFDLVLATLNLIDLDSGHMVLQAMSARGVSKLQLGARFTPMQGIIGRALRHGEPQLVNDVSCDPDYLLHSPNTVCEFALPVIRRGKILGVLNLESDRLDAFDAPTQLVLRTLADQLAGAVHLATINSELRSNVRAVADREAALKRSNEKLRRANESLQRLSLLDGLTGVANRRAFESALRRYWRSCARAYKPLSLILSDLDFFKLFNDAHGHLAGDDALRLVAKTMQTQLGEDEDLIVARYGGEEFAMLLPGYDLSSAVAMAEKSRVAIARVSCQGVGLSMSAGVASFVPSAANSADGLILAADLALYSAKSNGRNQVCVAPLH